MVNVKWENLWRFRSLHLGSLQTVHCLHKICWLCPCCFWRLHKDVDLDLGNGPSVAILSTVSIAECWGGWHFYAITYATETHQRGCTCKMLQQRKCGGNHKKVRGIRTTLQIGVYGGRYVTALRLSPTVITNSAPGCPGHQSWWEEGDSATAWSADICYERGDGMGLIKGLVGETSCTNSYCTKFAPVTHVPDSKGWGMEKYLVLCDF